MNSIGFIPYHSKASRLEIGVLKISILSDGRSGSNMCGIDLTDAAVEPIRRFDLKGPNEGFQRRNAEQPLDFVRSWGIRNYSSCTARIVVNIASWLTDGGRFRGMGYRDSSSAAKVPLFNGVVRREPVSRSIDETQGGEVPTDPAHGCTLLSTGATCSRIASARSGPNGGSASSRG